jgi:hypothetical protein
MSKKPPKGLGLHEPLRHPDHSRPRTRREFVAQGFMTGAASVVAPTLLGMLGNPRMARGTTLLAQDMQDAVKACGITTGAGKIPFICFDLAGGGNIAGSNVLVGGPKGQLDFLSVAGYNKLGLPGTMVPNPSTTGNFIDSSLGLRFHSDSAHLRGIMTRVKNATVKTNTMGTVIPALSQNDTNVNPHNPMYAIWQYGARGGLLDLIGSDSSMSGGNSMAPMTMMIPSATPVKISSSQDSQGLVSTGQLTTLLPPPVPGGPNPDVVNVMESMKRISDAKYSKVQAYTDPTANATALGGMINGQPVPGIQACGYTKSAYVVDQYGSPSAVNPDVDPNIVGASGIFTTAEYQSNNDYQKTAAIMKLVIDGNAAAGTIEMGGFDYHSGNRADGEAKDFNVGVCIGACLEYAARKNKPVMIYVFSDGSLTSTGMADNSVDGRGKLGWQGDNSSVSSTFFLAYSPTGRPALRNGTAGQQIGYYTADGSVVGTSSPVANSVNSLVQAVILNYMGLMGTDSQFTSLFPMQGLGSGSTLAGLTAFNPIV